jgi:uncharacterized protein HemY
MIKSNFIKIKHGMLELNIPTSLFERGTARTKEAEVEKLRQRLRAQYPWLTDNSVNVILSNAEAEMTRIIDSHKPAAQLGREMLHAGKYQQAFDWLEAHLFVEPEDVDAWYVKAEALFKLDRKQEGFLTMREAQTRAAKKAANGIGSRSK